MGKVMLLAVVMAELETTPGLMKLLAPLLWWELLHQMGPELPANLSLPTNLMCECRELGLYLVVRVFVNLNDVFDMHRFRVDLDLSGTDGIVLDTPRDDLIEISSSSHELSIFFLQRLGLIMMRVLGLRRGSHPA
jgi:hypothetical protein